MSLLAQVRRRNAHNVATLRKAPLAEISGSLGDLGTLLPLMIALAAQGSIRLGSTLVLSGLFNVLTGAFYGVPLPVQPMKAIAAAALASPESSPADVVAASGQWVAAAVLILSLTGLLRRVVAAVPVSVIKGIQLGAGLSLIVGAGTSLIKPLHWISPALDNRLWGVAAFLMLVATQKTFRFPFALIIFVLGLVFAIIHTVLSNSRLPAFDMWRPEFSLPTWVGSNDEPALWMAIGQLPLTTLNSIIAVSALSSDLLPDIPAPSVTSLGLSVAAMNFTCTWFGAMPVCHGAGGLAAQYRFGARSGSSIIVLGIFKIFFGLLFGETLVDLLVQYPQSLLGVLVFAAGLELAKAGQSLNHGAPDLLQGSTGGDYDYSRSPRRYRTPSDSERLERWTVMLTTTAGILVSKNTAIGFLAGMVCHWAYAMSTQLDGARHHGALAEQGPLLN